MALIEAVPGDCPAQEEAENDVVSETTAYGPLIVADKLYASISATRNNSLFDDPPVVPVQSLLDQQRARVEGYNYLTFVEQSAKNTQRRCNLPEQDNRILQQQAFDCTALKADSGLMLYHISSMVSQDKAALVKGRCRLSYLPLRPVEGGGYRATAYALQTFDDDLTPVRRPLVRDGLCSIMDTTSAATSLTTAFTRVFDRQPPPPESATQWPANGVPVEVFSLIARHLSNADMKCMRLVNREFEHKVASALFQTAVIPFNTRLEAMNESLRALTDRPMSGEELIAVGLQHTKIYRGDGQKLFENFGRHIHRFGLTFEITEQQLLNIPAKQAFFEHFSFHGAYLWPMSNYARFFGLSSMEEAADNLGLLREAFSHLENVKELALSLDSGMGWLNGPDTSALAKIMKQRTQVFRRQDQMSDDAEHRLELWRAMLDSHQLATSVQDSSDGTGHSLVYSPFLDGALESISDNPLPDVAKWPSIIIDRHDRQHLQAESGVMSLIPSEDHITISHDAISPRQLTEMQEQWLLEAGYAQKALVNEYILAIIDNPQCFQQVTTAKFAKISDGLLAHFHRNDFWNALPNLSDLTILVSPEWRKVSKDACDHMISENVRPDIAAQELFHILPFQVSMKKSIKKLHIGFVGGGETAEGIWARDKHVIEMRLFSPLPPCYLVKLSHIQDLTFSNCSFRSQHLAIFVNAHAFSLRHLRLHSVSLILEAERLWGLNRFHHCLRHSAGAELFDWKALLPNARIDRPQRWRRPTAEDQAQLLRLDDHFSSNDWRFLLQRIAPGLTMLGVEIDFPSSMGGPRARVKPLDGQSTLQLLELKSVGYVSTSHSSEPQHDDLAAYASAADRPQKGISAMVTMLRPHMSWHEGQGLGIIVRREQPGERLALELLWDVMPDGWRDRDQHTAYAARLDGMAEGSTGRYSGVLRRGKASEVEM